jgi:hypothetical protein
LKISQVGYCLLQFVFPTHCVHCSQLSLRFDRILCQHCFDLSFTENGEWQNATWIPFHQDSPLNSLWHFATSKNYKKPIKLLAALCITQWFKERTFIPDIITWYPDPEKMMMKNNGCKYLAQELARFFGVKCLETFLWKLDSNVFDENGNVLANCEILKKGLDHEGKRCLIVSDKELVMPNLMLQDLHILQLPIEKP